MSNSEHERLSEIANDDEFEEITLEDTKKKRRRPVVRILLRILGVAALLAIVVVCYLGYSIHRIVRNGGYAEKWEEDVDGDWLRDMSYGELPWQKMDFYVPKEFDPLKAHGALLFIHGGAWIGGNRLEQAGFAKRMAKEGYLTGNMEYMLYNDDLGEYKSKYNIQMVLADVDLALAKLVEVGRERGYEIDRVALCGHSAGGHISMLYGYTYKERENGAPPVEIAFVAPRVGPVDFHAKTWNAEKDPRTMTWFTSFLSGVEISEAQYVNPDEKTEAAIESISPLSFIESGIPPTLAVYGAKDVLVPSRHCKLLEHAFHEIKAKSIAEVEYTDRQTPVFDILVFPNSNHMLGRDPDFTLKWQGLFLAYSSRYLAESIDPTLDDIMREETGGEAIEELISEPLPSESSPSE